MAPNLTKKLYNKLKLKLYKKNSNAYKNNWFQDVHRVENKGSRKYRELPPNIRTMTKEQKYKQKIN
jgi:hypothetical protein